MSEAYHGQCDEEPGETPAAPLEQPLLISADMLAETPAAEKRLDFEKGISYLPAATLLLIALNVLIFLWQIASGMFEASSSEEAKLAFVTAGALSRQHLLEGQYWRLVSAMFLHGGPGHIAGNMFALYILGLGCEHALGAYRCILLYFLSGIGGSLLSILAQEGPSVGASGAIFGLQGALIVFLYRYRERFYLRDKRIGFVLLVWALYQVATGFLTPFIDNFAHIGGFFSGASTVLVLKPVLIEQAEGTSRT